jgi:hypothetical protein
MIIPKTRTFRFALIRWRRLSLAETVRSAILLIGGDKTGDDRLYQRMVPIADQLYDVYIAEIRKEGLIP